MPSVIPPEVPVVPGGLPIAYFPTYLLIDRDNIVRDVVIAAVDQGHFIARAQQLRLTRQ